MSPHHRKAKRDLKTSPLHKQFIIVLIHSKENKIEILIVKTKEDHLSYTSPSDSSKKGHEKDSCIDL